jgi:hypothetical protein
MQSHGASVATGVIVKGQLPVWALMTGLKIVLFVLLAAKGTAGLADETLPAERPKAVQSVKTPEERAREKAEAKHEELLERIDQVRKLLEDDRWLQEIADNAANKAVTERPKLPPGLTLVIYPGERQDNPFGNLFGSKYHPPGRWMQAIASKTAEGPRGTVTVLLWCDTRKIDVSKLR